MSTWYLLWMFVDVVALFAACVATPFLLSYALDSDHRARGGQLDWRIERLRLRNLERYGENFRPCLYCGIECSFGPECTNRDLKPREEKPCTS